MAKLSDDTAALVAATLTKAFINGWHLAEGAGHVGRAKRPAVFEAYVDFLAKVKEHHG